MLSMNLTLKHESEIGSRLLGLYLEIHHRNDQLSQAGNVDCQLESFWGENKRPLLWENYRLLFLLFVLLLFLIILAVQNILEKGQKHLGRCP